MDHAILLKPDNARSYYERGASYFESHQPDRALADLTVAIRLAPDAKTSDLFYMQKGIIHQSLAGVLDSQEQLRAAMAAFTQAIRCNKENGFAWHRRGTVHERLGDYRTALAEYNVAAKFLPQDQMYWLYRDRANVRKALGDGAGASADRAAADALAPR